MNEVGVFLSTTRIKDVGAALAAVRALGFRVVQLGKLDDHDYSPSGARELATLLEQTDLDVTSLCIVYNGESYASVDAVRETVGLLPAATVDERIAYSRRCITTAADLGIPLVTFHVGLLPPDPEDPGYRRVHDAVNRIAVDAAKKGIRLGLETGQETAEELLAFLDSLEVPVGVNFDGANFIAYQTENPLRALARLFPRVVGVHVKDYWPPSEPGLLSLPAPLGQGAARVDETLDYLLASGFASPLILETYAKDDPLRTLADARTYVLTYLRRRSDTIADKNSG